MESLIKFARLVENMRNAQKDYFRCRANRLLQLSKNLEAQVDSEIKSILYPENYSRLSLFDDGSKES